VAGKIITQRLPLLVFIGIVHNDLRQMAILNILGQDKKITAVKPVLNTVLEQFAELPFRD
jgi:hypothetical protein